MSGKNTKNNYKERERNEEKRTSAECVDKYLSLSDELCNNYLPPIKHGNVYFVFRTDILGLVVNNEILGLLTWILLKYIVFLGGLPQRCTALGQMLL